MSSFSWSRGDRCMEPLAPAGAEAVNARGEDEDGEDVEHDGVFAFVAGVRHAGEPIQGGMSRMGLRESGPGSEECEDGSDAGSRRCRFHGLKDSRGSVGRAGFLGDEFRANLGKIPWDEAEEDTIAG